MTREEAMELLELMRRQQQAEDSVAPLDPETLARAYVRELSRRRRNGRNAEGGGVAGNGEPTC